MTEPSSAVANAIAKRQAAGPNEASLETVRAKAREARALEAQIEDYEERISQCKIALIKIKMTDLPDLMSAIGIDNIGINAEGNMPAFDAKLKPFYQASIPAKATEEERSKAFAYLENNNAADLIKTVVTVSFSKEQRAEVAGFVEKIPASLECEVKASVHAATLVKWLRETVEKTKSIPDLEPINGFVGRTVELKDRKDK
jgi:hypothetical protein